MRTPIRFLLAGQFTQGAAGTRTTLSGERLGDVMARLRPHAEIEAPDHLGSAPRRRYDLRFDRPRALRASELAGELEPLRSLIDVATALVRPRDPMPVTEALTRVEQLVGKGPLLTALSGSTTSVATESPSESPLPSAPPPTAKPASGGIDIDALLSSADMPTPKDETISAAKSRVDAFVGAVMGKRPGAPASASADEHAKQIAALVLDAVEATVASLLSTEPAASLEANWRGVRMVLGDSPGHAELAIEILDVDRNGLTAALGHALAGASGPVPDAVFLLPLVTDLDEVAPLAELAADACVPVVFAVDPAALDDDDDTPLANWTRLRARSGSDWLAACTNEVVVGAEDTRVGPRVVFGSPTLALATMLAAALRRSHTFADALGRAGAVSSPASQSVSAPGGHRQSLPVRAAVDVSAARAMLDQAIAVVTHESGGERVLVVGAPMVAAGDGPSLPARIVIGRAVRAATAARDALAHGAGPKEIDAAFARASVGLLPEAPPGTCVVSAHGHGNHYHVQVELRPAALGRAFAFDFTV